MEDLATAVGVVAMLLEVLRQGGEVSGKGPPVTVEIVKVQGIRSSTSEERISAGSTKSLLEKIN